MLLNAKCKRKENTLWIMYCHHYTILSTWHFQKVTTQMPTKQRPWAQWCYNNTSNDARVPLNGRKSHRPNHDSLRPLWEIHPWKERPKRFVAPRRTMELNQLWGFYLAVRIQVLPSCVGRLKEFIWPERLESKTSIITNTMWKFEILLNKDKTNLSLSIVISNTNKFD